MQISLGIIKYGLFIYGTGCEKEKPTYLKKCIPRSLPHDFSTIADPNKHNYMIRIRLQDFAATLNPFRIQLKPKVYQK